MADVGNDGRHRGELLPAAMEAGPGGRMEDTVDDGVGIIQPLVEGNLFEDINRGEHGAEVLLLI